MISLVFVISIVPTIRIFLIVKNMTTPNISLSFYTFRNRASKPPWKFSDSTRNLYDLWTTGIMDFGIFFQLAHYCLRINGSTFIVDFTIHTIS